MIGTNKGHGHVWNRPDGLKARCGGPSMCRECALDLAQARALGTRPSNRPDNFAEKALAEGPDNQDSNVDKEPEFPTVEAECAYWKRLALAYGAQISAMKHVLATSWTVTGPDRDGVFWIEQDGVDGKKKI